MDFFFLIRTVYYNGNIMLNPKVRTNPIAFGHIQGITEAETKRGYRMTAPEQVVNAIDRADLHISCKSRRNKNDKELKQVC